MNIDIETARHLIDAQFPEYRAMELRPVLSGGTDNTIFRLGDALSARFPKREGVVTQIDTEHDWLPRFSTLPLRIPKPIAKGKPNEVFAFAWSIYDWCPGAALSETGIENWSHAANALARFIKALQAQDIQGARLAGPQNHFRGVPLIERDALTRAAFEGLADEFSTSDLTDRWQAALSAAPHSIAPVWLHGDLQGGNILVAEDAISAIIDFGLCGVGDPACDLMVAWSVLPTDVRSLFRDAIDCDEACWARGRGWALSVATIALDYYRCRNPALCEISRRTIRAVLSEY